LRLAGRFNPIVAWTYLGFVVLMVGIVLKKLVCANCYTVTIMERWCYLGWGKLSALLFRKGEMEKFSSSPGMKFAPFTYGILTADRSSSFSF